MRSVTSFFSPTLYKKHLQRYWPMAAVWGFVWMMVIPVSLWAMRDSHRAMEETTQCYDDLLSVMGPLMAAAAILVAVAVMFHLFKSPAASFINALPMRREGVFLTAFAAGYTVLIAPLVLVCLVTTLLECSMGVFHPSIWLLLCGSLLMAFFWLSFGMLCCVITGNGVAGAAFFVIFNGVVAGMAWLIQNVLSAFLYGFSEFSDQVWDGVFWFTPVVRMEVDMIDGIWDTLWVYAGVGFLMFLGALALHHIRKAERAGDLIAFAPLRWVFRVCVTVCGGLALGLLLYALLENGVEGHPALAFALCCALAAVIAWFVAEMLLRKTLRVFKTSWKGAAIAAVAFAAAVMVVDLDLVGFTTRVPQPGQVKSAVAEFSGSIPAVAGNGLRYEGENVEALTDLHRYLVENREEAQKGDNYVRVELRYDLGWYTMSRDYSFRVRDGGEARERLDEAVNRGIPNFELSYGPPIGGNLNWVFLVEGKEHYTGTALTPEQTAALWSAVEADVLQGNYRAGNHVTYQDRCLTFRWKVGVSAVWQEFYISKETVNVLQAIDQLGLKDQLRQESDLPADVEWTTD